MKNGTASERLARLSAVEKLAVSASLEVLTAVGTETYGSMERP